MARSLIILLITIVSITNASNQYKIVCSPKKCDCTVTGTLNCDGLNDVPSVALVPPSTMDPNRITVLSLKGNKINRLREKEILLGKSERLTRLTLSNNLIDQIDDGAFLATPALKYLDLSNNKINNLSEETFNGLTNLIDLRLDHNLIEDLSKSGSVFDDLENLWYLSMDWTPLKSVSNETFAGLDNLIDLSIDHAELSYLPPDTFKSLVRVETLSLRHNRFRVIPSDEIRWLAQLKHIDLSGNPIVTINSNSFRYNAHLRSLAFYNMPELINVEDCAFCNLHELRKLEIVNCNKFVDFDPEAFGRDNVYFRSLEIIDLANNSLTKLDEDMLPWQNVTGVLRLAGNPWNCDCELLWMMTLDVKIDENDPPICETPAKYSDTPVTSIRDYDSTFCIFTRISSRIRTGRLFLIVAILIIVMGILTTAWYVINQKRKNGLKFRNLFYKPQLPKYAYRNLAMGDEVEQDPAVVVTSDGAAILPGNNDQRVNRDLASRLAEDA